MNAKPLAEESLWELLDRAVQEGGERIALIDSQPTGVQQVTYALLQSLAASGARSLAGVGVARGDVVASWLPNSTEVIAIEFAAAALGAIVVGVNTRYGVNELTHLIVRTHPRCFVLPRDLLGIDFRSLLAAALEEAAMETGTVLPPAVLVTGGDDIGPATDFDVGGGANWLSLASNGDNVPAPVVGGRSDLVNMFTTSGSTGLPKFATHDQASVTRHARNVARNWDLGPGDVVLCVLPLCGVFGFNAAMAGFAAGASCLLVPVFEGPACLQLMAEWGVTHTCGGDDLYLRLMESGWACGLSLDRWRRGAIADFTGKAVDVVAWAESMFGARIGGVYGSSECFAFTAIRNVESDVVERARGGGDLVDDEIKVRVVDIDSGEMLSSEETGELQVNGYNVMREYFADPDATAIAFTEDGWLRTGDLGSAAPSGRRFTYQCRAGDSLRLHGFLVEPAEIERFLLRHPAVDGAHVVGVKQDAVEEAVAFVTLREPVNESELVEFCRQHLARYKVPRRIVAVQEFPVTTGTNGDKVRMGELREWAAGLLQPRN